MFLGKECVNVCISMSLLLRFKDLRIRERVCGALLGSKHNLLRNFVGTMRVPQEHRNQTKTEGRRERRLRRTDEGAMEGEGKKSSALDSILRGFLAANKYKAMLISPVFKYDRKYSPGAAT